MCKANDPSDSMNDGLSPSHSTGDSSIEQRKQLGSVYDDCTSDEEDRRYNTREYHYKKQPQFNAEKNEFVMREKKKEEMIFTLVIRYRKNYRWYQGLALPFSSTSISSRKILKLATSIVSL